MVKLARIQNVLIQIFGQDHPPAHVHVSAGGDVAIVAIDTGEILAGDLSPRTRHIVAEWLTANRAAARATFDALNPPKH